MEGTFMFRAWGEVAKKRRRGRTSTKDDLFLLFLLLVFETNYFLCAHVLLASLETMEVCLYVQPTMSTNSKNIIKIVYIYKKHLSAWINIYCQLSLCAPVFILQSRRHILCIIFLWHLKLIWIAATVIFTHMYSREINEDTQTKQRHSQIQLTFYVVAVSMFILAVAATVWDARRTRLFKELDE